MLPYLSFTRTFGQFSGADRVAQSKRRQNFMFVRIKWRER